jgi:hypothetical protein
VARGKLVAEGEQAGTDRRVDDTSSKFPFGPIGVGRGLPEALRKILPGPVRGEGPEVEA